MVAGNQSSTWHLHSLAPLGPGSHEVHVEVRSLSSNANPVTLNFMSGRITAVVIRK